MERAAFSLLGGPLHELARRVRLAKGTDTVRFGLTLGVGVWVVFVILAVLAGNGDRLWSLSTIGIHVRALVVIPLLFFAESLLDPRIATFVDLLESSGIVTETAKPTFDAELARALRWKDSWIPDAACLAVAVLMAFAWHGKVFGDETPGAANTSLAAQWYLIVGLSLLRFLLLRWLFRLGVWCHCLWRLSRLELRLMPTHPDGAAGLGYLEVVHAHFFPLALALSSAVSASLAVEIGAGTIRFEGAYPAIAATVGLVLALTLLPLVLFFPKLWACRVEGIRAYTALGERYVTAFDGKWLSSSPLEDASLLGTPDIQSLADLSTAMGIVQQMRTVTASRRLVLSLLIGSLVPMLPLLLLKYSAASLVELVLSKLTGP
jgi:hypothetical protein